MLGALVVGGLELLRPLSGGGVGEQLPTVVVEQDAQKQAAYHIEGEEEAVDCGGGGVHDQPKARQNDSH